MLCTLNSVENALARARDALNSADLEIVAILSHEVEGEEVDLGSKSIPDLAALRRYQDGIVGVCDRLADIQTVLSLGH